MDKWNLIIDVARCTNCSNCLLVAKDEHVGNDFPGYAAPQPKLGHRWIDVERKERGAVPMVEVAHRPHMCFHCDAGPCLNDKTRGVVKKREDGIVIIDPVAAKGRKDIVEMCPYGAIWWNEELALPQIWIFDAHLLDAGRASPRCADACPTEAIRAVKLSDEEMARLKVEEDLSAWKPELGTKPRVHYKNLDLFSSWFLGGTVSCEGADGRIECVEDADVLLQRDDDIVARMHTDVFGDFKFDRLPANDARYALTISAPGYANTSCEISLNDSRFLGEIRLRRA